MKKAQALDENLKGPCHPRFDHFQSFLVSHMYFIFSWIIIRNPKSHTTHDQRKIKHGGYIDQDTHPLVTTLLAEHIGY